MEGNQGQVAGRVNPPTSSNDLPALFCSGDEADDAQAVKRDGGTDDGDDAGNRPAKQAREESHKHARVNAVHVEAGKHNDEGIAPFLESGENGVEDVQHVPLELFVHQSGKETEPNISSAELFKLDTIAESHEMLRLVQMEVA